MVSALSLIGRRPARVHTTVRFTPSIRESDIGVCLAAAPGFAARVGARATQLMAPSQRSKALPSPRQSRPSSERLRFRRQSCGANVARTASRVATQVVRDFFGSLCSTVCSLLLIRSADGEWQRDVVARTILEKAAEKWSERRDLNSRPPVPQTGMLCVSGVLASPALTRSDYISSP